MMYQKTPKGSQAIATRDHALTPRMRSMLILVDGKRPTEELAKLSGAQAEAPQLLAQLQEQGFIEAVASPVPASAPAPLEAAKPAVTLKEAQRYAVRKLTDLMGPGAEALCIRIESTRSPQDFMQAVRNAETVLRDFGGAQMAASFAQEVMAHRPS